MTRVEVPPEQIRNNSLTRALNIFSDIWTILILRELFQGVSRFGVIQTKLNIPRQTLMYRLKALAIQRIIYKRPIQEERLLFEYHLTPMGLDLHSYALMIWQWQTRWNKSETMLSSHFIHKKCAQALRLKTICKSCGGQVDFADVISEPGPGAGFEDRPPQRLGRWRDSSTEQGRAKVSERTVFAICDRWSNLIMSAIFMGVKNFDAIQEHIGIAPNTLSARLKELVSLDILQNRSYDAKGRIFNYEPTPEGRGLFHCLLELSSWGDRWLSGWNGPPLVHYHQTCHALLQNRVVCTHCEQKVLPWDVILGTP